MSSPKRPQHDARRSWRQSKGKVCKHGVKKRCNELACGFVHRDEFHQDCRRDSRCKDPQCQYVHPPPLCHHTPCMAENCFFRHYAFTLAAHVAYFLTTAGKADLVGTVKAINPDIMVLIKRGRNELRLTHKKPVDEVDLHRAEQHCRKHVRNIVGETVKVPGATLSTLKRDSSAQDIANEHGIMLFYFHGGVNIVFDKRDRRAAEAVPWVKTVLESMFLKKQCDQDDQTTDEATASMLAMLRQRNFAAVLQQLFQLIPGQAGSSHAPKPVLNQQHVPVPNKDSALADVLKASFAALRHEQQQTCPDLELKLDDPAKPLPTVIISGPHDAVQRAATRVEDYLKGTVVRKINAPTPTRQLAQSLHHFLRRAVSELNDRASEDSSSNDNGQASSASLPYIRHRVHDSFSPGRKRNGKEFVAVHLTGPPNARADVDNLAQRVRDFMRDFVSEHEPLKGESQVEAFKSIEETLYQCDCNVFHKKREGVVMLSGSKSAVAEALDHLRRALKTRSPDTRLCAPTTIHARALRFQGEEGPLGALRRNVISRHPDVDVSLKVSSKAHPRAVARLVGGEEHVRAAMRTAIAEQTKLNQDMACVPVSLTRAEAQAFDAGSGKACVSKAKDQKVYVLRADKARKFIEAEAASSSFTEASAASVLTASIGHGQGSACRLVVLCGDFQTVRADVLVNAANDRLDHAGGLARAISVAAGPGFDTECRASVARDGSVPTGSARLTGSGNLAASHNIKHVVHAVAPMYFFLLSSWRKSRLAACVRHAIRLAGQQEGVRSIAMPAIGSGVFQWPTQTAATAIVQGLTDAANNNELGNIQRVILFDVDRSKADALAAAIAEAAKTPQPTPAPTQRPVSTGYTMPRVPALPKYVWVWHMPEGRTEWVMYDWDQQDQLEQAYAAGRAKVRLCGDRGGRPSDSKHVPEGKKYAEYDVDLQEMKQYNIVSGFGRQVRRVPYIRGDPLPPLFEERRQEALRQLHDLQQQQQQQQQQQGNAAGGSSPASSGRITNVRRTSTSSEAGSAAGASVGGTPSRPPAAMVDVPAHGFVLCGQPATVKQLAQEWRGAVNEMRETIVIDKFFKNDKVHNERLLKHPNVQAVVSENEIETSLDENGNIRASFLTEQAGHALVATLATVRDEVRFPETWTPMSDEEDLMIVEVPLDSVEYKDVVFPAYSRGGFSKPVVKVERVQNRHLWDAYLHRRELLLTRNGDANEKMLFHGTSRLDPAVITQQSFDFRVASSGMFGRGAYFAELLSYSDGSYTYSVPGSPGHKQVFIARVAAGNCEDRTSDPSIVRPSDGYDSVWGKVTSTHYACIVYKTDQAYPEYLVTYRDA